MIQLPNDSQASPVRNHVARASARHKSVRDLPSKYNVGRAYPEIASTVTIAHTGRQGQRLFGIAFPRFFDMELNNGTPSRSLAPARREFAQPHNRRDTLEHDGRLFKTGFGGCFATETRLRWLSGQSHAYRDDRDDKELL